MGYTTIFHIDDDHDDIYYFAAAIEHLSGTAKCFSFANAAKALHTLQSGEILPDAIFLDLNMPVINGQEFLAQLKASKGLGDIPVIILSTSEDPDTQQQLKAEGARGFLTKPSSVKELAQLLRPYFT
ncbi:response regulator [Flavobacterium gelatinilyticum]|uniref:response regulator n=1 Tax=Flavobacterium gelatinilyticum TaxID=3003260 RepID=UPI002481586D|nr:response regulator [Flavobacterium gelatinilyticum]